MRLLITGSEGFIGKNLVAHLGEAGGYEIFRHPKGQSLEKLEEFVNKVDAIIHLAGINRPLDTVEFFKGNADLTEILCGLIKQLGRPVPLVITSSTQVEIRNAYGQSKLIAEHFAENLSIESGSPVIIYRLPNVFGKWCRPNYNSVVATFCHNIANSLPININDSSTELILVYIDDVISDIIAQIKNFSPGVSRPKIEPIYSIKVGELADKLMAFKKCPSTLMIEKVGVGLDRALYATYVSYLSPSHFAYDLPQHGDERGRFVEMLKTKDSGQFSFFTAKPGTTRGGHYHHTKTEKFLVISGCARFKFRNILTDECYEITVTGKKSRVVESIPGWSHNITNIGDEEMIVMLWANEIFDRQKPDTITCKV
jgi:UDP-2-acetamido-2,6-beta-L-arabino-hexul-4-ose reductase